MDFFQKTHRFNSAFFVPCMKCWKTFSAFYPFFSLHQCDQIWRNFATLAKQKQFLAIFSGLNYYFEPALAIFYENRQILSVEMAKFKKQSTHLVTLVCTLHPTPQQKKLFLLIELHQLRLQMSFSGQNCWKSFQQK